MKSSILVIAAGATLLGACASAPTTTATMPAAPSNVAAYGSEVDGRTVDAVNRVARTNGIEVHWINYPQAKRTATDVLPAPVPTGT